MRAPAEPAGPAPVLARLPGAGYALGVLTFINLLNYLDRYIVSGVIPRIEETFGVDHAQAGWLQTVFILVYMLVAPLGGYLGDRYPRRWVLSLSIAIWSFATVGAGLAGSFAVLLLSRAIVGVGEAGYGTVSPGLIADYYPLNERTRALSVFYVAIPVGAALGYVLGGWIGNTWTWHWAFFVGGLPGLVAAMLALRMHEPPRGATEEGGAAAAQKVPFLVGLKNLGHNAFYWVSVAGLTLMTFSIGGLAIFMPTFLELERGVAPTEAAIVFGAVTAVSGILGTLIGGVLGDRAERKSATGGLWISGIGMLLAAPFMVWCAHTASVPLIYAAAFAAMFLVFLNNGPLNAAIVSAVPPLFRSFAVGLSVLIYHLLGDALSPPIIGWLGDKLSLGTAITLNAIPVFLGGLVLVVGARVLHVAAKPVSDR
jgi:MFS transporter, Spinster family, sphingosine-1-phosphate transporter